MQISDSTSRPSSVRLLALASLPLALALAATPLTFASGLPVVPAGVPGGGGSGEKAATQGYLGVELHDPTKDEIAAIPAGTAHGTEITRVDHDGPAGKAGLREHDLILQCNGQAIKGHDQLKHILNLIEPREARQELRTPFQPLR